MHQPPIAFHRPQIGMAERGAAATALSLPVGPHLSDDDRDRVAAALSAL